MKNKFLALAAIALTLGACSSDDGGSSIDYDNLAKKWYYVSDKVAGETVPYDDHETCGKDYVQINADGTAVFADVWDCSGTEPVTDESEAVWAREGNTLTFMAFGFTDEVTVKKLTSSSFEVSSVYDYDGDGDDETVVTVFTSTP